jgi:hypothetical protein
MEVEPAAGRSGSGAADDESAAEALVDALRATQMWFPCKGASFFDWARGEGLLP